MITRRAIREISIIDLHHQLQGRLLRMNKLCRAGLSDVQREMDYLSSEIMRISDAMADLDAIALADIKLKSATLEYLLPEEADGYITLCRSVCRDLRRI